MPFSVRFGLVLTEMELGRSPREMTGFGRDARAQSVNGRRLENET